VPVAPGGPARISLIRKPRTPVSHGRGHCSIPVPPTIQNNNLRRFPESDSIAFGTVGYLLRGELLSSVGDPCVFSRSVTYSAREALSSRQPRSRHYLTYASTSMGTLRTRLPTEARSRIACNAPRSHSSKESSSCSRSSAIPRSLSQASRECHARADRVRAYGVLRTGNCRDLHIGQKCPIRQR
jgi:hypothetical protein